jgi:phosphatidate cytidylyltransferase
MGTFALLSPKTTPHKLSRSLLARRPMILRVLSSLAMAVPAVLVALWGGWVFSLAVTACGGLMAFEWNRIAYGERGTASFALHLAGLAVVLVLAGGGEARLAIPAISVLLVLGIPLAKHEGLDPRWISLGTLYLLSPILALIWIRQTAIEPAATVLWLFAVVWATDISALASGRALGGPRLAPKLSPAKTWAGLGGGILGAAAVGVAGGWLIAGTPVWGLAVLGGLLAVVGQLGDLTESAFKRRFGVKDSSGLIPGQGGLLDRVDGLIFATLAVAGLALMRGGDVLFLSVRS